MRKIILKSLLFSALLTSFIGLGQGSGATESTTDLPIGIQNNFGVQNTREASVPSVLIAGHQAVQTGFLM